MSSLAGVKIEDVAAHAFRIPTEQEESDGTLAWDATLRAGPLFDRAGTSVGRADRPAIRKPDEERGKNRRGRTFAVAAAGAAVLGILVARRR